MSESSRFGVQRVPFGILMLDTIFPRIKGDVGHPETFSFPVIHKVIKGASSRKVVIEADPELLPAFIDGARELVAEGARAIATSCGFLAIFDRELRIALDVPVFSSSLLQVPLVRSVIHPDQRVGILTARKASLTIRHLTGVGISDLPLAIAGMDESEEFTATFVTGKTTIDIDACCRETVSVAKKMHHRYSDIGAIVLECTNMPPFSDAVRKATGLPVFDIVTLLEYAHLSMRWNEDAHIFNSGVPGRWADV